MGTVGGEGAAGGAGAAGGVGATGDTGGAGAVGGVGAAVGADTDAGAGAASEGSAGAGRWVGRPNARFLRTIAAMPDTRRFRCKEKETQSKAHRARHEIMT